MIMTNLLKERRLARGLSQAEVADQLGIATENYNRLETGKTELTLKKMERLARILHCRPIDFLVNQAGTRMVKVRASVQAGAWTESNEWPESDWYEVSVPDAEDLRRFPLYAAETRGPSMNKIYPEGTVVVFTAMADRPIDPQPGKRYIVERRRTDGMQEVTIKTLAKDDSGKFWLLPESTDPRFQAPIEINGNDGDTVQIIGNVVYSLRRED